MVVRNDVLVEVWCGLGFVNFKFGNVDVGCVVLGEYLKWVFNVLDVVIFVLLMMK